MRLPRKFIIAALLPSVLGHTWIEELRIINSNGTFAPIVGYPRGNELRTTKGFDDRNLVHLLPPNGRDPYVILPSDPMCRAEQSKGNQTSGSPALSASPGDMIALRYQENGHVSLPIAGKPPNRGTVYVYGTTQPLADEKFLNIHNVWTADGTGGDKRGVLLATRNYDDGQCYQTNAQAISQARQAAFPHAATNKMAEDLWCQTDIIIPASLQAQGLFTVYWVWDWPTAATAELPAGKPETYTSCMDIILVPGEGTSKKGVKFIEGQDLNEAAVKVQLTNQFLVSVGAIAVQGTSPVQTVSSTTAPTATPDSGVDVVTVTVTAPAITTMKTVTVTASPPDSPATPSTSTLNSAPTSSTSTLNIQPFLTSISAATATTKGTKVVTTVVDETVVITLTSTARMGAFTIMPRIRGRARL